MNQANRNALQINPSLTALPELGDYSHEFAEMREAELLAPVEISKDLSLRAKVIDACGLTCSFCHNEGTPVAVDNPGGTIEIRGTTGKSGRISVFSATNGVNFLPGRMEPADPQFAEALLLLRDRLGLNELHMTGGEPTLHPHLGDVIKVARNAGYSVSMTSNGERGGANMDDYAQQGLEKVNFSIFGTTPAELAQVQSEKFRDERLAGKKLDALHDSIHAAANAGLKVSANLVIGSDADQPRALRVIDEFDPRLDLRLLPDLSATGESTVAIYGLLRQLEATPVVIQVEAGSSNARVRYALPNGRTLAFKQIRPTRLEACNDCSFNNPENCMEGFYGTRLYVDKDQAYRVGICLLRMDLVEPINDFVRSDLPRQIMELRDYEYDQMHTFYQKGRS